MKASRIGNITVLLAFVSVIAMGGYTACGNFRSQSSPALVSSTDSRVFRAAEFPAIPTDVQPNEIIYGKLLGDGKNINGDVYEVTIRGSKYALKLPHGNSIESAIKSHVPGSLGGLPNRPVAMYVNPPPNSRFQGLRKALLMDYVADAKTLYPNSSSRGIATPAQIKKINDIFARLRALKLIPLDPHVNNVLLHPNGVDAYLIDNPIFSLADLQSVSPQIVSNLRTSVVGRQAAGIEVMLKNWKKYWEAAPENLLLLPEEARVGLSQADSVRVLDNLTFATADWELSEATSQISKALIEGGSDPIKVINLIDSIHSQDGKALEKMWFKMLSLAQTIQKSSVAQRVATIAREIHTFTKPIHGALKVTGRVLDYAGYVQILEYTYFNLLLSGGDFGSPDNLFENLVKNTAESLCRANPNSPLCQRDVNPQRTQFADGTYGWIYADPNDYQRTWLVNDSSAYATYNAKDNTIQGATVDTDLNYTDYYASPLCTGWYIVTFKGISGQNLGSYYASVSSLPGRTTGLELKNKIETRDGQSESPSCPTSRIVCVPPQTLNEQETECVCGNLADESSCKAKGTQWNFIPASGTNQANSCSCSSNCNSNNQLISSDGNSCISCNSFQKLSNDGLSCICKEGSNAPSGTSCGGGAGTWNAANCSCVCPGSTFLINGKCQVPPVTPPSDPDPIFCNPIIDYFCVCSTFNPLGPTTEPYPYDCRYYSQMETVPGQIAYRTVTVGSKQVFKIEKSKPFSEVKISRYLSGKSNGQRFMSETLVGTTDATGSFTFSDSQSYSPSDIGVWEVILQVGDSNKPLRFEVVNGP
jgi:hypothetical protein